MFIIEPVLIFRGSVSYALNCSTICSITSWSTYNGEVDDKHGCGRTAVFGKFCNNEIENYPLNKIEKHAYKETLVSVFIAILVYKLVMYNVSKCELHLQENRNRIY